MVVPSVRVKKQVSGSAWKRRDEVFAAAPGFEGK
jgi:hypothetical protein